MALSRRTVDGLLDGRDEDVGRDDHGELGTGRGLACEDFLEDRKHGMSERSRNEEACESVKEGSARLQS